MKRKNDPRQAIARHHEMVADPLRTPILEQAVKQIVKPGDTVFDLGCGTGTLTLAALRAGARKVYACDIEEVLQVARQRVAKASFAKRVVFLEGLSSEVELAEPVDVILSETVGSLGFNENILPFLLDARERFLKPGGRILPASLSVWAAPCSVASKSGRATKGETVETPFEITAIDSDDILGPPKKMFGAQFLKNRWIGFDEERDFKIQKTGTLQSFAGWFEATWAPGLITKTSPANPLTHWKQSLLPTFATPVLEGDTIRFRLRFSPDGEALSPHSIIEWGCEKLV